MSEMNRMYDAIVVGGGHAGVEAGLALARLNKKVLMVTMSLDSISFMACNPNIGGTAKGHLVREIDALGGQMGQSADKATLQLRMLNLTKGPAVHSLRGQADKIGYHTVMKTVVEDEKNLELLQSEIVDLIVEDNVIKGVITSLGSRYLAQTVILCCGVYLDSKIIIGNWTKKEGPSGFSRAEGLTQSLLRLGIPIRRFKTGTPARVHSDSIDYSKMIEQVGDENIYPFSFMNDCQSPNTHKCYLTYTNEKTHNVIRENIHLSPLYNGVISGVGPRYCPSIEDKIMRFKDKERHQIFVEPESANTKEMYIQGMSSSLPHFVQEQMYRSIEGLENCQILRYAYAIEYDCIDSTILSPGLMVKNIKGLFMAGQICGSSGYEEAGAQGLMAGINANKYIDGDAEFVLGRDEAYIGVLIDDLVTKGTNEPYRMMTARAESRLHLRQENADLRLTKYGYSLGLATKERYNKMLDKKTQIEQITEDFNKSLSPKLFGEMFVEANESMPAGGLTFKDMLKRNNIEIETICKYFREFDSFNKRYLKEAETMVKYEGYLQKQKLQIADMRKLEDKKLPSELDYSLIQGLRLEARSKLNLIKPLNLGQASRISGVSPADITVLMVYLARK